jgi:hypothetical protein
MFASLPRSQWLRRCTICSASFDRLARAADPAAVRERIVALLDRCERELGVLLDETTQPRSPPDVAAQ